MIEATDRWWHKVKKMRVLWLNLLVVLVGLLAYVKAAGFDNVKLEGGYTKEQFQREITQLFQKEMNLSLKYLYTGIGYGSQMVERPGMAQYLRKLSDTRWEEAIQTIKKYMQKGGNAGDLFRHNHFSFEGTNDLTMTLEETIDTRNTYLNTLEKLHRDSKDVAAQLNNIHQMTQEAKEGHYDGEWSHFVEERLEKESARRRKTVGDITTLNQMSNSAVAFHIFDSHLQ